MFADFPRHPHVVGHYPPVLFRPRYPCVNVFGNPRWILLFSRQQIRIRRKGGGGEVDHRIPFAVSLDDHLSHARGQFRILSDRFMAGTTRHIVKRHVVPIPRPVGPIGKGPERWPSAPIPRTLDDFVLRVEVLGIGVFAHEKTRKLFRTRNAVRI